MKNGEQIIYETQWSKEVNMRMRWREKGAWGSRGEEGKGQVKNNKEQGLLRENRIGLSELGSEGDKKGQINSGVQEKKEGHTQGGRG